MPLRLLLDENISPVVVDHARRLCPEIEIESVNRWRNGAFMNQEDRLLLIAAASENWTLVTYDRRTIPGALEVLYVEGASHSGVIYIDERIVGNDNFGLLIRSLVSFWRRHQALDWQDREQYLDRASG